MTHFHFHHQYNQLNGFRGWAGALIWDFGMRRGVQYIYPTIQNLFGNPAPLGVSFTCDPSLKINVLSFPSCKGRMEIKGGTDILSVITMFRKCFELSQHCHNIVTRKCFVANRLVYHVLIKYFYVQICYFLRRCFSFFLYN